MRPQRLPKFPRRIIEVDGTYYKAMPVREPELEPRKEKIDCRPVESWQDRWFRLTGTRPQVKNTGGSEGTYSVLLTVDGVDVETKDVTVAPETTEEVSGVTFECWY